MFPQSCSGCSNSNGRPDVHASNCWDMFRFPAGEKHRTVGEYAFATALSDFPTNASPHSNNGMSAPNPSQDRVPNRSAQPRGGGVPPRTWHRNRLFKRDIQIPREGRQPLENTAATATPPFDTRSERPQAAKRSPVILRLRSSPSNRVGGWRDNVRMVFIGGG